MNVSIGPKWEKFVHGKLKSGDYQNASEVVRDGLRLLEREDLLKRISVSSMEELQAKLMEAARSIDQGNGIPGDEAFQRLRQRSKERRKNG